MLICSKRPRGKKPDALIKASKVTIQAPGLVAVYLRRRKNPAIELTGHHRKGEEGADWILGGLKDRNRSVGVGWYKGTNYLGFGIIWKHGTDIISPPNQAAIIQCWDPSVHPSVAGCFMNPRKFWTERFVISLLGPQTSIKSPPIPIIFPPMFNHPKISE